MILSFCANLPGAGLFASIASKKARGTRILYLFVGLFGVSAQTHSLKPAAIMIEGAELIPTFGISQYHNNNILLQPGDTLSSNLLTVNPGLKLLLADDSRTLGVSLDYEAGYYDDSEADDYADTKVIADFTWLLNRRNQLDLDLRLTEGHETRGTGYSEGPRALELTEPDTFSSNLLGLKYRYGGLNAKGRLVVKAQNASVDYTSRRAITFDRNRDERRLSGEFFLRLGGRTHALFEVRNTDINYLADRLLSGAQSLDGVSRKYYVGINWRVTGRTEGSLRLGQATRGFDASSRADFSGFSWELEAKWSPRSYSQFILGSARAPKETDGSGSYIDATVWELAWDHHWSDRVRTHAYYNRVNEDYVANVVDRTETLTEVGIRGDYALRRWFDIGFSAVNSNKVGNIEAFEFNSNQVALHLTWSL